MARKSTMEIQHKMKYQNRRRLDFLQTIGKAQDTATYDARMRFKTPSYYQTKEVNHDESGECTE